MGVIIPQTIVKVLDNSLDSLNPFVPPHNIPLVPGDFVRVAAVIPTLRAGRGLVLYNTDTCLSAFDCPAWEVPVGVLLESEVEEVPPANVGDRIRILWNFEMGTHPTEERYLKYGDEVTVAFVGSFWYQYIGFDRHHRIRKDCVATIVNSQPKMVACTCNIMDLMAVGCRCGYMGQGRPPHP